MRTADEHLDKQEVAPNENGHEEYVQGKKAYRIIIMPTFEIDGCTLFIHTPTRFTDGGGIWLDLVGNDDNAEHITRANCDQAMLQKLANIFRNADNINRGYGLFVADKMFCVQIPCCDDYVEAVDTVALAIHAALKFAYGEEFLIIDTYDNRHDVRGVLDANANGGVVPSGLGNYGGRWGDLGFHAFTVPGRSDEGENA